jgi:putative membrane protein
MVARRLSAERIVRAGLYLILGGAAVLLVLTGGISALLHPRMHPWLLSAGAVFLGLSVRELSSLRTAPRTTVPFLCYAALAFVIAMAAFFPSVGSKARGRMGSLPPAVVTIPALSPEWSGVTHLAPDDSSFWSLFKELARVPAAYAGKPITVAGFVFREPRFPPGASYVARNLIWCCSADMMLIGYLATGAVLDTVPADRWVEVNGTLDTISFDPSGAGAARPVPVIRVESLRLLTDHPADSIFPGTAKR